MSITARLVQRLRLALNDTGASSELVAVLNNLLGGSAAPWLPLTPGTGWAAEAVLYGAPEYRVIGDVVQLRGGVESPVGDQSLPSVLLTLPAAVLPPPTGSAWTFPASYQASGPTTVHSGQLLLSTSTGTLTLFGNTGAAATAKRVSLAGLAWSISP